MNPVRALSAFLLLTSLALTPLPGWAEDDPPARLFWPVPPNPLCLEFVGIFSSQNDFPKTNKDKWVDALLGVNPAEKLALPSGVAVLPDGRILVTERKGRNVKVFDFAKRKVDYLFKGGMAAFEEPVDIAVGPDERIYVADRKKQKILAYDRNLAPLLTLSPKEGFKNLEKLAIDANANRIFASDSQSDSIFVFSAEGSLLHTFGGSGKEPGQLSSPHGLAIDNEGRVFVADTGNGRIQIFDGKGNFQGIFQVGDEKAAVLQKPWDVAIDGEGRVHVIDQARFAIITCSREGELLLVTGASRRSDHPMGFVRPVDIHIDGENRIFVTDDENKRFCIWQYMTEAYLARNPVQEQDVKNLVAYLDSGRKNYEEKQKQESEEKPETMIAGSRMEQKPKGQPLKFLDGSTVPIQHIEAEPSRRLKCPNCGLDILASVSTREVK